MAGSKKSNAGKRCWFLPIPHHAYLLPVPIEVRPYICAALAADPAAKPRLNIGQPEIIRPVVGTNGHRVAAAEVGAIDKQSTNAHIAHFCERDLGRALGLRCKI